MTPNSDFGISKVSKAALKVSKGMQKSECVDPCARTYQNWEKLGQKCCRLGPHIPQGQKFLNSLAFNFRTLSKGTNSCEKAKHCC